MGQSNAVQEEAKVFNENATEGVRAVAFVWFFRRIAIPLGFFLSILVITAFVTNGPIAGLVSLMLFGPLFIFLWLCTARQGKKVLDFLRLKTRTK